MPEKSTEKQRRLDLLEKVMGLTDQESRLSIEPVAGGMSQLRNLDVAAFSYNGKTFMVLCVLNERTGTGDPFFTNIRTGNKLLSCFDLQDTSPESLAAILGSLYNMDLNALRKVATYRYFKNLFSVLLGKRNYKTFNKLLIGSLSRFRMK